MAENEIKSLRRELRVAIVERDHWEQQYQEQKRRADILQSQIEKESIWRRMNDDSESYIARLFVAAHPGTFEHWKVGLQNKAMLVKDPEHQNSSNISPK